MKSFTQFLLSISIILIFSSAALAQYCIPPGFKDMGGVGEPFTYISNVQLENLNNTTGMPTGNGGDNGYTYFSSLAKPVLQQGSSYTLKVTGNDNLSSGMEIVVWIDWNGDKTFDPSGEQVAAWSSSGNQNISITVPTTAPGGMVRMRVYCDMPVSQGHITPEPCGYLNYPSHAIGQHGEVEDYDIFIGTSTGISINDPDESINVYPVPAKDILNIGHPFNSRVSYFIVNAFGQNVKTGSLDQGKATLDISKLTSGQYIIILQAESGQFRKSFHILR